MKYHLSTPERFKSSFNDDSNEKLKKSTPTNTSNSQFLNDRKQRRLSFEIIHNTLHRQNIYMNVAQVNIMLTKMVLIICLLSSFEHIFLLLGHLMFTSYLGPFRLDIIFFAHFSMLAKHSIHILIFYYFNSFFKNRIRGFVFRQKF